MSALILIPVTAAGLWFYTDKRHRRRARYLAEQRAEEAQAAGGLDPRHFRGEFPGHARSLGALSAPDRVAYDVTDAIYVRGEGGDRSEVEIQALDDFYRGQRLFAVVAGGTPHPYVTTNPEAMLMQ